jgi:hypothetical protein
VHDSYGGEGCMTGCGGGGGIISTSAGHPLITQWALNTTLSSSLNLLLLWCVF